MRTSMRDIAKALDLSIATVSRALAGNAKVKPETVQRIKAKAAELGYEPDAALNALNAYREGRRKSQGYHGVIAWLTHFPDPEGWKTNWTSLQYYKAMQRLAPHMGYKVEPFWIHPEKMPADRMDQILRSRGIRGIVLPSFPEGVEEMVFDFSHYSVVAISETVLQPRVHSVQKSAFFDIRMVVKELATLGYRRPLLAVHTPYHQGMHGVHEGAFMMSTQELMGHSGSTIHARRELLGHSIEQFVSEHEIDVVVSTVKERYTTWQNPVSLPWVSLNLHPDQDRGAGVVHEGDQIPKVALEHLISMLHRGEVGLPAYPIVMRLQGIWHRGDLNSLIQ
ncbi:LacI family DNA-binding transcriptional regulator [Kiritimatiellota bacterium B12222]|nr:LacI family DNA-binding transcriptional regulator [Kiritimatiellota bacterium B12222]